MSLNFIGCDLGGTNLRAGIVNSNNRQVSHLKSTPTLTREGHDAVMARMGALIEDVITACSLSKSEIGRIGIGSPTFGEWKFGAGQGVDSMACFAIGTGIGGGLVLNGQLHLGIGGTGGELGHQMIDFNGPPCGCGNQGCLEAYASGPAIASMGIKAVVQGRITMIGKLVDYDINKINSGCHRTGCRSR